MRVIYRAGKRLEITVPLNEDLDNNSELGASSVRSRKLTEKGQEEKFGVSKTTKSPHEGRFPAN